MVALCLLPPCSFLNISTAASAFIIIPLSTYNVKDSLNDFTKLPSLLIFQKVFSIQIRSPVGIEIRKIHKGKESFSKPVRNTKDETGKPFSSCFCFDLKLEDRPNFLKLS